MLLLAPPINHAYYLPLVLLRMLIPGQNIAKCVGGDFPVLVIDLCPKGGALAHFQSQGDSKKHTNILIIAAQKCPTAEALVRMNCKSLQIMGWGWVGFDPSP